MCLVRISAIQNTLDCWHRSSSSKFRVFCLHYRLQISELELLTYWTTYLYCRCNKSVSYATPAYYAHVSSTSQSSLWTHTYILYLTCSSCIAIYPFLCGQWAYSRHLSNYMILHSYLSVPVPAFDMWPVGLLSLTCIICIALPVCECGSGLLGEGRLCYMHRVTQPLCLKSVPSSRTSPSR